LQDLNLA